MNKFLFFGGDLVEQKQEKNFLLTKVDLSLQFGIVHK